MLQGPKPAYYFAAGLFRLAAFRAGLPYTVIDNTSPVLAGSGVLINPRPDLVDPTGAVLSSPIPIPAASNYSIRPLLPESRMRSARSAATR